ncbi:GNAT family N-acetyltransferase [Leptospira sp. GIMC2001]|uniref:GNAT family N-acetyltransferase n=1 Tax=Leptospira sp. GIMC2001 TaxID=1513297 RepID=UPI002349BADB|nr:GNAT family N-acetyltransferase [Leptospira sp. GIMC2001]WCL50633.1 GNAT family N-acetyltransferase [Leptospira sp. GIMC2001]
MQNIEIRKAEIKDLDGLSKIFDLYRVFYKKESNIKEARKFLFERFVNFQSIIFIAVDIKKNAIVGFTQLYPTFSSLSMGRAIVLNDLFVLNEYRKLGIAKRILAHVNDFAVSTELKGIELSTSRTNENAQALYATTGYVRDDEFYHYFLKL